MSKKIALICNIRTITNPKNPEFEQQADFDDKETMDGIKKSIETNWYEVFLIQHIFGNPETELKEKKSDILLAFNFTEWDSIPKILEKLEIPYTWSDATRQAIIYDKSKTKEVLLKNNILTPDGQTTNSLKFNLKSSLKFPLIVKPVCQWSSAGITNKSLVYNEIELRTQVESVLKSFAWDILIETFLDGREFSIWMVGNPPMIMPIIEADHSTLPEWFPKIDSLEVKRLLEEESEGGNHLICPARIEKNLEEKIKKICFEARNAVGIYDYCRMDVRCDNDWNPYILEINSPAWLMPPEISTTSYLPLMARKVWISHEELVGMIIDGAKKRYGI